MSGYQHTIFRYIRSLIFLRARIALNSLMMVGCAMGMLPDYSFNLGEVFVVVFVLS